LRLFSCWLVGLIAPLRLRCCWTRLRIYVGLHVTRVTRCGLRCCRLRWLRCYAFTHALPRLRWFQLVLWLRCRWLLRVDSVGCLRLRCYVCLRVALLIALLRLRFTFCGWFTYVTHGLVGFGYLRLTVGLPLLLPTLVGWLQFAPRVYVTRWLHTVTFTAPRPVCFPLPDVAVYHGCIYGCCYTCVHVYTRCLRWTHTLYRLPVSVTLHCLPVAVLPHPCVAQLVTGWTTRLVYHTGIAPHARCLLRFGLRYVYARLRCVTLVTLDVWLHTFGRLVTRLVGYVTHTPRYGLRYTHTHTAVTRYYTRLHTLHVWVDSHTVYGTFTFTFYGYTFTLRLHTHGLLVTFGYARFGLRLRGYVDGLVGSHRTHLVVYGWLPRCRRFAPDYPLRYVHAFAPHGLRVGCWLLICYVVYLAPVTLDVAGYAHTDWLRLLLVDYVTFTRLVAPLYAVVALRLRLRCHVWLPRCYRLITLPTFTFVTRYVV